MCKVSIFFIFFSVIFVWSPSISCDLQIPRNSLINLNSHDNMFGTNPGITSQDLYFAPLSMLDVNIYIVLLCFYQKKYLFLWTYYHLQNLKKYPCEPSPLHFIRCLWDLIGVSVKGLRHLQQKNNNIRGNFLP